MYNEPRNRVVLAFSSNLGRLVRFTIPRACLNKTSESARSSMEALIEGGAIVNTNGVPVNVHSAKLVSTVRTPLIQA